MICNNLEHDICSVYPYNSEDIQEILCKMYSILEGLKNNGQVVPPELLKDIEMLKKNMITLSMFGAVGDGVTDCIEAFEKAITFCKVNKIDTLYIPDGKYYVSKGIVTNEIKIVGLSKPFAPDEFNDYARPNLHTQYYRKYLNTCKGSIITSDKPEMNIFKDGLYAENILIYGNCRAYNQNGIGQIDGGTGNQIRLENVYVICCGQDGINAPYGLISPRLFNCQIRNNIRHAVYIGKEVGGYTGETNDIIFKYNNFNHNGSHGLNMHLSGRLFHIENNTFEKCYPSPSHTTDRRQDITYGCKVVLTNIERTGKPNPLGTGGFIFKGNYSELTMGLLWIKNETDAFDYEISNNFFGMWGKGGLSTSIYIDVTSGTKLNNVSLMNNIAEPRETFARVTDNVFIEGWDRVFNLNTNHDINKDNSSINRKAYSFKSEMVDNGTISFMNSNGVRNLTLALPNPFVSQYPPSYDEHENKTTFTLNNGTIKKFKLADNNDIIGSLVKIGNYFCGYVIDYNDGGTSGADTLTTFGRADGIGHHIGQTLSLLDAGSVTILNGKGEPCKLIVDHAGNTFGVKKEK